MATHSTQQAMFSDLIGLHLIQPCLKAVDLVFALIIFALSLLRLDRKYTHQDVVQLLLFPVDHALRVIVRSNGVGPRAGRMSVRRRGYLVDLAFGQEVVERKDFAGARLVEVVVVEDAV